MSLKTDFYDGATGLNQQCNAAFDAGVVFVTTTNLAAISAALVDAASKGKTKFTVSLTTSYQTAILRDNSGNNLITKSYLAGVQSGLADQDIYNFEASSVLNMSDNTLTKIDITFNFQTA